MTLSPVRFDALPKVLPKRAVYVSSEGTEDLYVGRTNDLRGQLRNHCRPTANQNQATFAFRIARQAMVFTEATYTPSGSRASLMAYEVFGPEFEKAKGRVRQMDIRFIEEIDAVRHLHSQRTSHASEATSSRAKSTPKAVKMREIASKRSSECKILSVGDSLDPRRVDCPRARRVRTTAARRGPGPHSRAFAAREISWPFLLQAR